MVQVVVEKLPQAKSAEVRLSRRQLTASSGRSGSVPIEDSFVIDVSEERAKQLLARPNPKFATQGQKQEFLSGLQSGGTVPFKIGTAVSGEKAKGFGRERVKRESRQADRQRELLREKARKDPNLTQRDALQGFINKQQSERLGSDASYFTKSSVVRGERTRQVTQAPPRVEPTIAIKEPITEPFKIRGGSADSGGYGFDIPINSRITPLSSDFFVKPSRGYIGGVSSTLEPSSNLGNKVVTTVREPFKEPRAVILPKTTGIPKALGGALFAEAFSRDTGIRSERTGEAFATGSLFSTDTGLRKTGLTPEQFQTRQFFSRVNVAATGGTILTGSVPASSKNTRVIVPNKQLTRVKITARTPTSAKTTNFNVRGKVGELIVQDVGGDPFVYSADIIGTGKGAKGRVTGSTSVRVTPKGEQASIPPARPRVSAGGGAQAKGQSALTTTDYVTIPFETVGKGGSVKGVEMFRTPKDVFVQKTNTKAQISGSSEIITKGKGVVLGTGVKNTKSFTNKQLYESSTSSSSRVDFIKGTKTTPKEIISDSTLRFTLDTNLVGSKKLFVNELKSTQLRKIGLEKPVQPSRSLGKKGQARLSNEFTGRETIIEPESILIRRGEPNFEGGVSGSITEGLRTAAVNKFNVGRPTSFKIGGAAFSSSFEGSSSGTIFSSPQKQFNIVGIKPAQDQLFKQGTLPKQDQLFKQGIVPDQRQFFDGGGTTRQVPITTIPPTSTPFTPSPPPVDDPFIPFGGFKLPTGGAPFSGRRGRSGRAPSFKTKYNPSLAASVLNIRGSKAQGLKAASTGIQIRPLVG